MITGKWLAPVIGEIRLHLLFTQIGQTQSIDGSIEHQSAVVEHELSLDTYPEFAAILAGAQSADASASISIEDIEPTEWVPCRNLSGTRGSSKHRSPDVPYDEEALRCAEKRTAGIAMAMFAALSIGAPLGSVL
jgi:hypothetical protein